MPNSYDLSILQVDAVLIRRIDRTKKWRTVVDIGGRIIWQQACGDTDRNFADICLKWDVILIGPGRKGEWPKCKVKLIDDGWTARALADIERFAKKIKDGDIVVLHLGTKYVLGVGVVDGEYIYRPQFSDVDGWDLQHVRRVHWLWKGLAAPKQFDTYTLKWGATTQKLDSPVVVTWLKSLDVDKGTLDNELVDLPRIPSSVHINEISEFLFAEGVSSNSIETLVREIGELFRIARWYDKDRTHSPSESETVTYLVVPLLRALGWTPQRMAVEWNKVDLALFNQLPRTDSNVSVVVEAKKIMNSCLSAKSQAESYAKNKVNCSRLIVTDGLRYGVYLKTGNEFKLAAYLNLTSMKDQYGIYECLGAREALQAMTPEFRH